MKQEFTVIIEETVSEEFEVCAENRKEAIKKATENYKTGKFLLEPGNIIFRQMAIINSSENDTTE